ncbi:unnamed protein product, partial [Linum tenue]
MSSIKSIARFASPVLKVTQFATPPSTYPLQNAKTRIFGSSSKIRELVLARARFWYLGARSLTE